MLIGNMFDIRMVPMIASSILVALIIASVVVTVSLIRNKKHKESDYYIQTGKDLFDLSNDKGSAAEFKIGKRLEGISGYKKLIYNCYIPKSNGGTTEIDVLMVHEKGIFVIESKNYIGWIFGNEEQTQWTQVLKSGRNSTQKNHFYNPIKQNITHLKWLEKYLEPLNLKVAFYSLIVFGNSCVLKNITITSNQHAVMNECYLFDSMQKHIDVSSNVFSCDQVNKIYEKLYVLTQVSEAEKLAHIQGVALNKEKEKSCLRNNNFKNDYNFNREQVQIPKKVEEKKALCDKKCPKCGAMLVVRTVKNGERAGQTFLGCSNYPKCRYTEKL